MFTEKLLQNALTSLLSDSVADQGRVFFESLRGSGLCSEEEIAALESEWQELIQRRRAEGAGSAENLQSLLKKVQEKAVGERLTSEEDA